LYRFLAITVLLDVKDLNSDHSDEGADREQAIRIGMLLSSIYGPMRTASRWSNALRVKLQRHGPARVPRRALVP